MEEAADTIIGAHIGLVLSVESTIQAALQLQMTLTSKAEAPSNILSALATFGTSHEDKS